MASSAASKFFSYHRLAKDDRFPLTPDEAPPPQTFHNPSPARVPYLRWIRLRRSGSSSTRGGGGSGWWRPRRPKVRVAGLNRLLGRKARLLRAALRKVVQRFKEGKAHFGDLFAGNYLFLQVNPTSAASAAKTSAYLQQAQRPSAAAGRMQPPPPAAAPRYRLQPPPPAAAPRYYLPYRVAV